MLTAALVAAGRWDIWKGSISVAPRCRVFTTAAERGSATLPRNWPLPQPSHRGCV